MSAGAFLGLSAKQWMIIGFAGQFIFGGRFLIQWICSEVKKESHIPMAFWYMSVLGGMILLLYAISIKNPVFIMGQSMGLIVYTRNLMLISRKNKRENLPQGQVQS